MAGLEPALKRVIAFVDGQNLFRHVKEAFGYDFPNFDINKLVNAIVSAENWNLQLTHFYTGMPDGNTDPKRNAFWTRKLAVMGRQGIKVYTRPLRYRNKSIRLADKTVQTLLVAEEKGIDVRIALDVIGKAVRNEFDVALVFSQDQDLSEVADEIRLIAAQCKRWIRIASAYPVSPTALPTSGGLMEVNGSRLIGRSTILA